MRHFAFFTISLKIRGFFVNMVIHFFVFSRKKGNFLRLKRPQCENFEHRHFSGFFSLFFLFFFCKNSVKSTYLYSTNIHFCFHDFFPKWVRANFFFFSYNVKRPLPFARIAMLLFDKIFSTFKDVRKTKNQFHSKNDFDGI